MRFAHLTVPTQHVERTASFLEQTLGCRRSVPPGNSPVETQWLEIGDGRQLHVVYVEGFEASPFEGEFGRHVAVVYPRLEFDAVKQRLIDRGADVFAPLRPTPFERFFFRDPVNGYVFEVIEERPGPGHRSPATWTNRT